MHIAVIIRMVPDPEEELELNEDGNDLDREWLGFKVNEFDDYALEEALLIKDENPETTVTVLAIDDEGAERALQTVVAKGADRAIKVNCDLPQPSDSQMISGVFETVLPDLNPDLLLVGVQAPNDISGQLSPILAARLKWAQASVINNVRLTDTGIEAEQDYGGGRLARLFVPTPAVLGVQSSRQPPRYVSGTKLREVRSRSVVESLDCNSPGPANAIQPNRLAFPEYSHSATRLEGSATELAEQLVNILKERKLVK